MFCGVRSVNPNAGQVTYGSLENRGGAKTGFPADGDQEYRAGGAGRLKTFNNPVDGNCAARPE
jgi:hypothetical protein